MRIPHPRVITKLILGHQYVLWSHASLANLHIRFAVPCAHPTKICSIDSVVLQSLHVGFETIFPLTIWVLWMALYRYCWALV